ncbi:MAG: tripartite tricarboxylate transporter permease [Candidatus Diapherotrites archaeon]|nr:tripartite tricarboxylate transporter permease [Candidatus Diapherotrites archaeon]
MIELLLFVFLGCVLGVFTGLTPGIHSNTVSFLVLAFGFSGSIELAAMFVAMGVTQSFVDFIPNIIFGAPDSESFIGMLPGHRLLVKGEGMKAVGLATAGCLFGGIGAILLAGTFMNFVSGILFFLPKIIPAALALVLFSMVLSEKGTRKKAFSALVISLSALVGVAVLTLGQGGGNTGNSLMAPITGFFAISTLVYSICSGTSLKRQEVKKISLPGKKIMVGSLLGIAGASAVSILPGVGASEAAFIIRKAVGKIGTGTYLVLIGAISTANIIFSLFVLLAAGKTRTGIAAIVKVLAVPQPEMLWLFISVSLIAMAFAALATFALAKFFLEKIRFLPYGKVNVAVLLFLALVVLAFNGFYGLAVMGVSACIGLIAVTEKVKRSHCMAFLMVPTILIYLAM